MGICWIGYRRAEVVARGLFADQDEVETLLESDDPQTSLDLDKAWHGVHWLLTGSDSPTTDIISEAICGGDPVGEDMGYVPPRLVPPERVAAVANILQDVTTETLRARMDPAAMDIAGVYPSIWDEEDVFDSYLAPSFEALKTFYATAAMAGDAVIQVLR